MEILPAWDESVFKFKAAKAAFTSVIWFPGLVILVQLLATAVSAFKPVGFSASMPYWKISALLLGWKPVAPRSFVSRTAESICPFLIVKNSLEPKSLITAWASYPDILKQPKFPAIRASRTIWLDALRKSCWTFRREVAAVFRLRAVK